MNPDLVEQAGGKSLRHVVPDVNGQVFRGAGERETSGKTCVSAVKRDNHGRLQTSQRWQSTEHPCPGFCGPEES